MLKLLGKASSINVRKVLWTCQELGLPLAREDWGSGFRSTQEPTFLALNPNGLVPVLIDGERVLWESNTICRYLAGREGRRDLLPQEPGARAAVEMWMDWQATDLNGAWRYVFMSRVRGHADYQDAASLAAAEREWNRLMGLLDKHLAQHGPYAAGAAFTLADVVLGLSLNRWQMTPFERPNYAALAAYQQRLLQRPGYVQHGANGLP
ncbi:glutathione S-transferase family protein [Serratia marcescens]|uniref:glutathione S-transferase family protein n=1 Tax=Serratia TaxID=613 RepID=UPI0007450E4D|nr:MULTISPECIES: glutathione S-transferase family protein [Serratia]EMD6652139.1 glutathione S-transferase family protein [Serratia marcescens]MBD8460867.1 glutathione S-transferase family protein [Serratia marcescens]MBH3285190.1 glutathione S-transferase family protein [Serratia marcescens]MCK1088852.1 glutathione S-transferase family protein [Serratia marcescens]MCT4799780.1 glutathione S-transferase family protein [Serratia marcescens]